MSSRSQRKPTAQQVAARFRERNNREPRNAGELVNFSKKMRGAALGYGEARKFFESGPKRNRGRRNPPDLEKVEEKATEPEPLPEPTYAVGDAVLLIKNQTGVIRFVGPVEFAEGLWYGVELHPQYVGRSDGTKDGTRYFECEAQRGVFLQEEKIRRKMNRKDHARNESWLAANAERNSHIVTAPLVTEATEATEEKESVENDADNENPPDSPPATEEKVAEDEEVVPPADEAEVADAANEEDGGGIEDDGGDAVEDAEAAAGADDEAVEQPAEENADEENQDDGDGDEAAVEADAPAGADPEDEEGDAEADAEIPDDTEEMKTEEPVVMRVQVDDADFYPAKEGENVLQFIARQMNFEFRKELLRLYLQASTTDRLRMICEDLKAFPAGEQRDLLMEDVIPMLKSLE